MHERCNRPVRLLGNALAFALLCGSAAAQEAPSRAATIEDAQAKKATALHPYEPGKAERIFDRVEDLLVDGSLPVHPFFESAYAGGGFTLGAGYLRHVSAYNRIDLRGSVTLSGYTRVEAEFVAPRLFTRRASLALLGGWRKATEVGFYGLGTANTSADDRANYSFEQPYGSVTLGLRPMRLLVLAGGVEVSTWNQGSGGGAAPSVDEIYTSDTLDGLGASPTYVHTQATVALDSRASAGYARRGGLLGVTVHDFHDTDGQHGFRRTDYEVIHHVPILRETWVLSLHARAELADAADGQSIPFFMLPALGGGSSLRGFASWRFRDLNSLLLQAEWRVVANRFLDMALFYDAGRVAARRSDLTDGPLKSDYGIGFRMHGPLATPLRVELARSNEGLALVFSAKAAF
jgi:outer membrane protein assembly factor BamA